MPIDASSGHALSQSADRLISKDEEQHCPVSAVSLKDGYALGEVLSCPAGAVQKCIAVPWNT